MSNEVPRVDYAPDDLARKQGNLARRGSRMRSIAADLLQPGLGVSRLEPGWAWPVLGLWAIGRAVNLTFLSVAFLASTTAGGTFGPDGQRAGSLMDFLSGWDADRYGRIAMQGYPTALPVDIHGTVLRNDWAFLPVYPYWSARWRS